MIRSGIIQISKNNSHYKVKLFNEISIKAPKTSLTPKTKINTNSLTKKYRNTGIDGSREILLKKMKI